MSRNASRVVVALLCSAACGTAVADMTFRCGSKLIEIGMSQGQVIAYCGEPTSRSVEMQDVRSGNRAVGRTDVHTWVYESYSATRVLKFDQTKLIAIQ